MYEILNFLKGGLIDNYWYALLYLIIGTHITIMGGEFDLVGYI